MGVYIDSMNARFGRMIMCHMMADTTDELLQMADKIGVKRKWIQDEGTPREHFDVSLGCKKKALDFGAEEVGFRKIGELCCRTEYNGQQFPEWFKIRGKEGGQNG